MTTQKLDASQVSDPNREGALPTPLERIVMILESARTQHHAATGKETDLPF